MARSKLLNEVILRVFLIGLWALSRSIEPWSVKYPDDWSVHRYPFSTKTALPGKILVPSVTAFGGMMGIVGLSLFVRDIHYMALFSDLVRYFLASSLSLLVTANVTNFLKIFVGRPRPDYINRCLPSLFKLGPDALMPRYLECERNAGFSWHQVIDGRKSFPSGHASYFAAVGICGALFLFYMSKAHRKRREQKGVLLGKRRIMWPVCVFVGLIIPVLAGWTRIIDRRHHFSDVAAGLGLGYFLGFACFRLYYHPSTLVREYSL